MKKPSQIKPLLKRRQLNVAEQNAVLEYKLFQSATWFRLHRSEIPAPIREFLEARSIDLNTAIDFEYEDLSAIGLVGHYGGLIVTLDQRFWRWELQLDETRSSVVTIEDWSDVTNEFALSTHMRGIGKTRGLICVDIVARLNSSELTKTWVRT